MDLITSLTSQVMNKALDGLSKRHKAIASNLANVDTPNYRRRDISFEGALENAISETQATSQSWRVASNDEELSMKTTKKGHMGMGAVYNSLDEVQPQLTESENFQYRNDGNAVDVETEMSQLAKNTQKYMAITNLAARNLKSIRSVITGGGG
jgi:flagellar basal-body rod protein FlgB